MMSESFTENLSLTWQATEDFSGSKLWLDAVGREARDPDAPEVPGYELTKRMNDRDAAVWRARQLSTGQMVAVHWLEAAQPERLAELRQLFALGSHPYLRYVLDAKVDQQPAFLVTPLWDQSLSHWMKTHSEAGELNARALTWLEQAAQALSFLHQNKILHLDIQPHNLLLDSQQALRLVHPGWAHQLGRIVERNPAQSLFLASPEQLQAAAGGAPDVSGAYPGWDLYSLGATFYYILTGYYPRTTLAGMSRLDELADPLERLEQAWIQLHLRPLVPVLSYNPKISPRLAVVIERSLSLSPHSRYRQVDEILLDLRSLRQTPENTLDRAIYALRRWMTIGS